MSLNHWWFPFRKTIYKFKLSHRCVFCKKYSQKKNLINLALQNNENILPGHVLIQAFHARCLKDILDWPENYTNKEIDLAVWIPDGLKEIKRIESDSKRFAEEQRRGYIEKANAVNLGVFIDEATGKLSFERKET